MILNNNAKLVKVKSKMSKVPGNILSPCAISTNVPVKKGRNNQKVNLPFHNINAEVKE